MEGGGMNVEIPDGEGVVRLPVDFKAPLSRRAVTHAELVAHAKRWLHSVGCSIALTEMKTYTTESPDAIGWKSGGRECFLIECKTSRADFHADKNKPFRREPGYGMGGYRYYLAPVGVLKPEDMPPKWGLIVVGEKGPRLLAGVNPRTYERDMAYCHGERNLTAETCVLWSALNRLRLHHGDGEFHERVHATYAAKKQARLAAQREGDGL
jgi:hypothetical protein